MLATAFGMAVVRVPVLLLALYICTRLGGPGLGLMAVWIGIFADS